MNEDSDLEFESIFDDNIRGNCTNQKKDNVLVDKTNKLGINNKKIENFNIEKKDSPAEFLDKNNFDKLNHGNTELENKLHVDNNDRLNYKYTSLENSGEFIKKKYNLEFSYEKDKLINEYHSKMVDDLSSKLHVLEANRENNKKYTRNTNIKLIDNMENKAVCEYPTEDKIVSNNNLIDKNTEIPIKEPAIINQRHNDIGNRKMAFDTLRIEKLQQCTMKANIKDETTTIVLNKIQDEFDRLKNSHKQMLQLRNRIFVLLDNEINKIKEEVEKSKIEELHRIKEYYETREADKLKEVEYYKEKYERFKVHCREKVIEYKNRVDKAYKDRLASKRNN